MITFDILNSGGACSALFLTDLGEMDAANTHKPKKSFEFLVKELHQVLGPDGENEYYDDEEPYCNYSFVVCYTTSAQPLVRANLSKLGFTETVESYQYKNVGTQKYDFKLHTIPMSQLIANVAKEVNNAAGIGKGA